MLQLSVFLNTRVGVVLPLLLAVLFVGGCWPNSNNPKDRTESSGNDQTSSQSPSQPSSQTTPAQWTGIAAATRERMDETPKGNDVIFGHVEDGRPNTGSSVFKGVTFQLISGQSKSSGHANATARLIYGPQGLAPGVTHVNLYETTDWIRSVLKPGTAESPDPGGCHIFTHSWITRDEVGAPYILRRLDHMIDSHDTLVIVGVDNGGNSKVPALLASAYNVIAVGSTERRSSTGYTRLKREVPGRCKPELVGHMAQTSFNTPIVAAVAARLLQSALRMARRPAGESPQEIRQRNATKAEAIKAILLTGAEKSVGFQPEENKPLDAHHGAGSVRFDTSHYILRNGPRPPDRLTSGKHVDWSHGWDIGQLETGNVETYAFRFEEPVKEAVATLVWHRRIIGQTINHPNTGREIWVSAPSLANFNLALTRSENEDGHEAGIVAKSVSRIDNVEHIYFKDLPKGSYRINVSRGDRIPGDWDYALAWRFE